MDKHTTGMNSRTKTRRKTQKLNRVATLLPTTNENSRRATAWVFNVSLCRAHREAYMWESWLIWVQGWILALNGWERRSLLPIRHQILHGDWAFASLGEDYKSLLDENMQARFYEMGTVLIWNVILPSGTVMSESRAVMSGHHQSVATLNTETK